MTCLLLLLSLLSMVWSGASQTALSSLLTATLFKAPESVTKKESDVLTGSYGSFTKAININRLPTVPLQGKGTEESPYLISSATDWNALADYITTIGDDFEGRFLKVSADISFGDDIAFKSLWNDNVNSLNGTFDGDGHTVSGINYTTTATYQAPMGVLGESGVIKNLTLEGDVTSEFTYAGGFTAKVYGTLKNVVNKVNVTSTKSYTSGFGYLYTGANLEDVVNKATISTSTTYVAGISSFASGRRYICTCRQRRHYQEYIYRNFSYALLHSRYCSCLLSLYIHRMLQHWFIWVWYSCQHRWRSRYSGLCQFLPLQELILTPSPTATTLQT